MALRIVLADDHEVVREGLSALLRKHGFDIVGEASNGLEAVGLVGQVKPDILTMYREDHYVLEALRAGVAGYILKSRAGKDLVEAIGEVAAGATYLGPDVSHALVKAYRGQQAATPRLSSREQQVLQLIAQGKSTKEVASVLGISVKTASAHRSSLMRKLDVHETASLVRYAIRSGFISA